MDLQGKHVLITGASRGIGAAMARCFAKSGARVSVAARSGDALAELAAELNKPTTTLLEQLSAAGVPKSAGTDAVT